MALPSFERRECAFEAMRPNSFNQGDEEHEDSEDEEFEDDPGFPEPDPEGASIDLFKILADPKVEGKLSAKDVCCIMFNARALGCKGMVVLVAKRHFRKALGLGKTPTRKIRSQTPWPRQIGGRDDPHRANYPGTRETCTRSDRGTIPRAPPRGRCRKPKWKCVAFSPVP